MPLIDLIKLLLPLQRLQQPKCLRIPHRQFTQKLITTSSFLLCIAKEQEELTALLKMVFLMKLHLIVA